MLQAGRSWVQFLIKSLDFSVDLILPAALWTLGLIQSLTEMNTRNFPGDKVWLAHKADNLTVSQLSRKCGEAQHLTNLWASMACYRDSFTFLLVPLTSWRVQLKEMVKPKTLLLYGLNLSGSE
jgi:hypothetical protein